MTLVNEAAIRIQELENSSSDLERSISQSNFLILKSCFIIIGNEEQDVRRI